MGNLFTTCEWSYGHMLEVFVTQRDIRNFQENASSSFT